MNVIRRQKNWYQTKHTFHWCWLLCSPICHEWKALRATLDMEWNSRAFESIPRPTTDNFVLSHFSGQESIPFVLRKLNMITLNCFMMWNIISRPFKRPSKRSKREPHRSLLCACFKGIAFILGPIHKSIDNNGRLIMILGFGWIHNWVKEKGNQKRRSRDRGNLIMSIIMDPIKTMMIVKPISELWADIIKSRNKETSQLTLSGASCLFMFLVYRNILSYINYPERCSRVWNNKFKREEEEAKRTMLLWGIYAAESREIRKKVGNLILFFFTQRMWCWSVDDEQWTCKHNKKDVITRRKCSSCQKMAESPEEDHKQPDRRTFILAVWATKAINQVETN